MVSLDAAGYPIYGSRKNFATQLDSIFESSECHNNGMLYLCAQWKAHGLEVYDTEAWSKSEVHESASQAVMAGEHSASASALDTLHQVFPSLGPTQSVSYLYHWTMYCEELHVGHRAMLECGLLKNMCMYTETERLIKEEEKTIARKWEREQLPKDVLNQLSEQSTNYRADQIKQAQVSQRPLKPPAAACKLFIRPEPEADGDRAILAIHVRLAVIYACTQGALELTQNRPQLLQMCSVGHAHLMSPTPRRLGCALIK